MFFNPNLSFTLYLYFTILITHQALSITSIRCHKDDENGLLAFKSGIKSDPSRMLKTWKPKTDCCKWTWVTCSTEPNSTRVTGLYIDGHAPKGNNILSGQISPSLANLKFLVSFGLKNLVNLTGPFPEFLVYLPNITTIAIRNSKLNGRLPKHIGHMTNLMFLDLSGNRFSGSIPSSFRNLVKLEYLNLSYNRLSGGIPITFKLLKKISSLDMSFNKFTGTLPDMFQETIMTTLHFSNNKFTGKIPQNLLANWATSFDFSSNKLTGELPEFGDTFHIIGYLNLSRNQFSGGVPASYEEALNINILDLSHNQLNGSFLPQKVGNDRVFVRILDLSFNNFKFGNIPKWIDDTSMTYLGMAKCGIKIKLNNWKPKATYKKIDLSENEITGSPLQFLNSKVDLEGFWASKNKLKFDMKDMKVGKNLKSLDLSNNLVHGMVPKTVSTLNELNVSNNHLCGKLPATKFPVSSFIGNDCLCGAPLPSSDEVGSTKRSRPLH